MRFASSAASGWYAPMVLALAAVTMLTLPGAPGLTGGRLADPPVSAPPISIGPGAGPGPHLGTAGGAVAPGSPNREEPRRAAVGPNPELVNPYRFAKTEPAAIGVSDYGIDGSGLAYNYSSTEFVGVAQFASVDAASTGGAGRLLGIQMNLVLTIGSTPHPYVYWVRFAPWVNASNDVLTLQNEVFNLTTSATDNPSPISGRGSINTAEADQYQYTPPCSASYPGNCAAVSFPSTLELRATSEDPGGVPSLLVSYRLGGGWISEDNISFPSLKGLPDHNFVVNGTSYTPTGLFYDAELVLGGPYHGFVQTNRGSGILLSLEEFNGHNLQAVPNAWDFGADSSNTFDNATTSLSAENGSPADQVGSGTGTLGPLYAAENESRVTIVGVPMNGTLLVDGGLLNYTGGSALVELAPGPSTLELFANGSVLASKNVTLTRGEVTTVSLGAFYPVTIREQGLPGGRPWSIEWQGVPTTSNQSTIVEMALNGTYELRVGNVTGFVCNATAEAVVVRGPGTIRLGWSPFLFEVTFAETGLPSGTVWWVTMDNQTVQEPTSMLNVSAGNGSYAYDLGAPFAYVTSATTGNVSVQGPTLPISVEFGVRLSSLAGIVRPESAILSIDGSPVALNSGAFNVTVDPGTHSIGVSASGYASWSGTATTTPGNTTELQLELNATPTRAPPGSGSSGTDWPWVGGVVLTLGGVVALAVALAVRRGRNGPGNHGSR